MKQQPPREVRVSVRGLVTGMYVSRLDRPWEGSGFRLAGFEIRDEDDIRKLQSICKSVYIDTASGVKPDPQYLEFEPSGALSKAPADELGALRVTEWNDSCSFEEELAACESAQTAYLQTVDAALAQLRNTGKLELPALREGIAAMMESVLRNPAAFIWQRQIKHAAQYSTRPALGRALWAVVFGRRLGLDRTGLQHLALGALLCDHAGRITDDPMRFQKQMARCLDTLQHVPGLPPQVVQMVAHHRERHDGLGLPQGLHGREIPVFGRILGLVDRYEVLTAAPPAGEGRSPHDAVNALYEQRGKHFQAELVEQFIQACGLYPPGSLVELSTGEVAVVAAISPQKRLRPRVMLLLDREKQALRVLRPLDLGAVEESSDGLPLTIRTGLPTGAFGIDTARLLLG